MDILRIFSAPFRRKALPTRRRQVIQRVRTGAATALLCIWLPACTPEAVVETTHDSERRDTTAWDCARSGYVVTNRSTSPEVLWLFLPGETLQLTAASVGDSNNGETVFSNSATKFMRSGNTALLEQNNSRENCTENRRASIRENAKLRGVDFWATGNEPPWILEIGANGILIKTGYELLRTAFPPATPVIDNHSGTAVYSSHAGDNVIEVHLASGHCSDSMSGEAFAASVKIDLNDTQYFGCGQPLH